MIAWVLIVSMGTNSGYTVPGIASEQACRDLHAKIAAQYYRPPNFQCLPYEKAR